jgi:deoxyadenosine/deoxycytidine kinase
VVVELAGPSGSGKSTLARELARRGILTLPRSVRAYPLAWRLAALRRIAVPFGSQVRHFPARRWNRLKLMVQLEVLYDALRAHVSSGRAVVVDQGPIYRLSILQRAIRQDDGRNGGRFVAYWDELIRRWASVLDLVVVLDADDDALYERIQTRQVENPVLGLDRDEAVEIFHRARADRETIIESVRAVGAGVRVIRVDTQGQDAAQCAADLADYIRQLEAGRRDTTVA